MLSRNCFVVVPSWLTKSGVGCRWASCVRDLSNILRTVRDRIRKWDRVVCQAYFLPILIFVTQCLYKKSMNYPNGYWKHPIVGNREKIFNTELFSTPIYGGHVADRLQPVHFSTCEEGSEEDIVLNAVEAFRGMIFEFEDTFWNPSEGRYLHTGVLVMVIKPQKLPAPVHVVYADIGHHRQSFRFQNFTYSSILA